MSYVSKAGLDAANVVLLDIVCDISVYIGSFIYIEDVTFIAKNANADSYVSSNVLGLCERKSTPYLCDVRVLGVSREIFSNLDVTKEYFLSDVIPGGITDIAPTLPNHIMVKLGQPMNDKQLLILKGQRVIRK